MLFVNSWLSRVVQYLLYNYGAYSCLKIIIVLEDYIIQGYDKSLKLYLEDVNLIKYA